MDADTVNRELSIAGDDNRRRSNGDRYHAALRDPFNRMLGQLHHCLARHEKFDETIAFHQPTCSPLAAAA
ncbi:hypothetical protein [Streptomyces camelliae]|uniref:Uncharacterized protein n=1 Tax=Streptomyces camelliae TaxID=3004093 RepID=A0ABY7NTR0_9ACTN|nr:hypothetical protein [Streptomyces sp. HUAS 2-6]WBO61628.1 hypothetical protein O1G22_01480 [Streptomyces sp. HUAS 2-6]